MDSLLEKAAKFLTEHPEVNEIELSDTFSGIKVHLIRVTPAPWVQLPYNYYHYPYP